jgi:hypothetical protein
VQVDSGVATLASVLVDIAILFIVIAWHLRIRGASQGNPAH